LCAGPLGFGAAPLGNMFRNIPEQEAAATVEAAWQEGTRYFDTAPLPVDPNFRIHVSDQLLEIHDGPFLELGLKGIVGVGTRSQCAELAGKPPAQVGHGQARKGTGSDPCPASRSSMPVPGFRSCTMQKKRFVGTIRLPSYAIPLTVLI